MMLCRAEPLKRPGRALVLTAVYGAVFALLPQTGGWLLLALTVLHVLLGGAVWLLMQPPAVYAATCALLAFLFAGTLELLRLAVGTWDGPAWLPAVLMVPLAAVCRRCGAAILPEASELLVASGYKRAGGFFRNVALLLAVLPILCMWVWYQCLFLPRLRGGGAAALAVLSAAVVFAAVLLLRRLAFDAAAQAEAVIDRQYQAELLNFIQIIRSQRHDFNFHIQALSGMIQSGKYQECSDYINAMVKTAAAMNDVLPLRDPAVSALLNAFRELALQKGISFDVSISDDLAHIPCTVYEINTVIGNLLQNAVEEVEQNAAEQRWVRILILKRGGSYIIKTTNPCPRDAGTFKNCFQPGYTTKQSHEGIGLAAVRRIVNKYHGDVFPEFEDSTVSFVVQLVGSFS